MNRSQSLFSPKALRGLLAATLVMVSLSACVNTHEALLRSTDYDLKYRKAVAYFEANKYTRAQQLLEQLQMAYRGTLRDDTLQYLLGLSNYHLNDFVTAEDNFRRFAEVFPRSSFTKMARFLQLDCLYESTYRYQLDQLPTHNTIAAIEEFMYDYPGNEFSKRCQVMLADLQDRLERKSFESAKLYYTVEDYKAASYALKQALKEQPESRYREDILYYIVAANFKFASNSIPEKQRERFLNVIDEYYNFISEFPDSRYRNEVDGMFKRAQRMTSKNQNKATAEEDGNE